MIRMIGGFVIGSSHPDIRFKLQYIEKPYGIRESWREISSLCLNTFFTPEVGIGRGEVIKERSLKQRLGMGIKTDLWKDLNRVVITGLGQIIKNLIVYNETELIPVLSAKKNGSQLS
jgi:hypothetical protein